MCLALRKQTVKKGNTSINPSKSKKGGKGVGKTAKRLPWSQEGNQRRPADDWWMALWTEGEKNLKTTT